MLFVLFSNSTTTPIRHRSTLTTFGRNTASDRTSSADDLHSLSSYKPGLSAAGRMRSCRGIVSWVAWTHFASSLFYHRIYSQTISAAQVLCPAPLSIAGHWTWRFCNLCMLWSNKQFRLFVPEPCGVECLEEFLLQLHATLGNVLYHRFKQCLYLFV